MAGKCTCSSRTRQSPRVPRRRSSQDLPGGFRFLGKNDWKTIYARHLGGNVYRVIELEDTYESGYRPIIGDLDLDRKSRGEYFNDAIQNLAMNGLMKGSVPTKDEKILAIGLYESGAIEDIAAQSFADLDDAIAWAMTQV